MIEIKHFAFFLLLAFSEASVMTRFRRANKEESTRVKSLHVESKVMSRFATTHVRSEVVNLANEAQEIFFEAQLPSEAFISNFTMEIDGRLEVAEVKGKEEAKQDYERAKSSGNTAGLVAQKPRETDMFRTSVNVRAQGKIKFDLTYQEVLQRRHGVYKHIVNIVSTEGIESVKIDVVISERGKMTKLKVPAFAPKIAVKTNKELLALPDSTDVAIRSSDSAGVSTTHVSFTPNQAQKSGQLAVLYDVERSSEGGEIEVVDGYFVHFFAPQSDSLRNEVSANFVFVLDKSGSMDGRKFQQMQEAMRTILPQLNEEDKFSIVYFSSDLNTWESELQDATEDNKDQALNFINRQSSGGGTNIHGALLEAMRILDRSSADEKPAVIIFLTDGMPSAGEIRNPDEIRAAISQRNRNKVKIHSLAFGDDADETMLRQLSKDNTGLYRKIFIASDAALQLDGFYSEISVPLFTDLKITYLNGSVETDSLIQNREDKTLYEGSEIMVLGKVAKSANNVKGSISGKQSDGAPIEFRCGNECFHCCDRPCPAFCGSSRRFCPPPFPPPIPVTKVSAAELPPNTLGGFIERMWAYQTIKKKLDEAALNPGEATKLRNEAKALALQYNFVTELTSLVIVDRAAELKPVAEEEKDADRFSSISGMMVPPAAPMGQRGFAGAAFGPPPPTFAQHSFGGMAPSSGTHSFGGMVPSLGMAGMPGQPQATFIPRTMPAPTNTYPPWTSRRTTIPPTTTPPPCRRNIFLVVDTRAGSQLATAYNSIVADFLTNLRNAGIEGKYGTVFVRQNSVDLLNLQSLNPRRNWSIRRKTYSILLQEFQRDQNSETIVIVLHGREELPTALKNLLMQFRSDGGIINAALLKRDMVNPVFTQSVANYASPHFSSLIPYNKQRLMNVVAC